MKKKTMICAAIAVMMTMTACADTGISAAETTSVSAETSAAASAEETTGTTAETAASETKNALVCIGNIKGQTYTNKDAGIKLKLPDDWEAAPVRVLAKNDGIAEDEFTAEKITEKLQNEESMLSLYECRHKKDNGDYQIILIYAQKSFGFDFKITGEDDVQQMQEITEEYSKQEGSNATGSVKEITFVGDRYMCVEFEQPYEDSSTGILYDRLININRGEYSYQITMYDNVPEGLDEMTEFFTKA